MATQLMNEVLFRTLQDRLGEVKITNEGQARMAHRERDTSAPTGFRVVVDQRGEEYAVDCPFCGDTRWRCYINHRYGLPDPFSGARNFSLWCCHNEGCHRSPANRDRLRQMTAIPLGRERRMLQAPAAVPSTLQPIVWPEGAIPLNALTGFHAALDYVIERGFDPDDLATTWGVSYCKWNRSARPDPTGRLVFPIGSLPPAFTATGSTLNCERVGWQARAIPSIKPPVAPEAKYLTAAGLQKSKLLYGLPQALQEITPVFIVEGVTDVWRIGPGAVAILGKSMSRDQKQLAVQHFAGRPIIIMLDADARDEALALQRDLQRVRGTGADNQVVVACTPQGRDPADCSSEAIIRLGAQALGIQL